MMWDGGFGKFLEGRGGESPRWSVAGDGPGMMIEFIFSGIGFFAGRCGSWGTRRCPPRDDLDRREHILLLHHRSDIPPPYEPMSLTISSQHPHAPCPPSK